MPGLIILGIIIYLIIRHNKKKEKNKTVSKADPNAVEQEVLEKMTHSILPKVIIGEIKNRKNWNGQSRDTMEKTESARLRSIGMVL